MSYLFSKIFHRSCYDFQLSFELCCFSQQFLKIHETLTNFPSKMQSWLGQIAMFCQKNLVKIQPNFTEISIKRKSNLFGILSNSGFKLQVSVIFNLSSFSRRGQLPFSRISCLLQPKRPTSAHPRVLFNQAHSTHLKISSPTSTIKRFVARIQRET